MEFKELSREELMDFLINGISMPESSIINKDTINFYFEELVGFINLAENDYEARLQNTAEIVVNFNNKDYIVMRAIGTNLVFFMTPEVGDRIEELPSEDASNIIGLVYGVIVYNDKWEEMANLANRITTALPKEGGKPIKVNSPEMKNLKDFITSNRKYKI